MNQEITETEETVRVPVMQKILDNPFLLLFIGVVVPTVFYTPWDILETPCFAEGNPGEYPVDPCDFAHFWFHDTNNYNSKRRLKITVGSSA